MNANPTNPNQALLRSTHDTPIGRLTFVADANGLRAVLWPDDLASRVPLGSRSPVASNGATHDPDVVLRHTAVQIDEYLAGDRRQFDLPLAPAGTPFQQSAWAVLRSIPYGTTMSYAEQARALGDVNKARAVGAADGRNPLSIVVPCHRVTGAGGRLTGFAGGLDAKAWLLGHERAVSEAGTA
ncbi:methylated-DNA--[protein]-cysteine S-methyltransferase [soil metagenome]